MSSQREEARRILGVAESLRWEVGGQFQEQLMQAIFDDAARIADRAVTASDTPLASIWIEPSTGW